MGQIMVKFHIWIFELSSTKGGSISIWFLFLLQVQPRLFSGFWLPSDLQLSPRIPGPQVTNYIGIGTLVISPPWRFFPRIISIFWPPGVSRAPLDSPEIPWSQGTTASQVGTECLFFCFVIFFSGKQRAKKYRHICSVQVRSLDRSWNIPMSQ